MGLFDMFGAGGGRLQIQPQSPHVSAGSSLAGAVGFQGGSRPQQITKITLKLVMDQTQVQHTPQGPQQRTQSRDVIPAFPLAAAFTSTPGQVQQFGFDFAIPAGIPNSTPGQVKYRLVASADIDNEVDPGTNVEIQVVGGAPVQMGAPGMMPMQPAMMQPAPTQIGSDVVAQWTDGQWHPARVVAMQNGMIGVDWANPALGQSSWVYPQQVQAQQAGMAMGAPMMAQPPMQQHDPYAKQQHDPYAKQQHDPYAKQQHDPYAKQQHAAPHAKQNAPHAGAPAMLPQVGAQVLAQWQDGQWHPARVVAMQNGLVGVDWENPKLGQSSWVQPQQVRGK